MRFAAPRRTNLAICCGLGISAMSAADRLRRDIAWWSPSAREDMICHELTREDCRALLAEIERLREVESNIPEKDLSVYQKSRVFILPG
jgi:hypothetical protein